MAMDTKDYLSFSLSVIALGVSLYNLWRARRDALLQNQRSFEQKRFEAAALASDIKSHYLQSEGALEAVRFEAKRARDASLVSDLEVHIASGKSSLQTFTAVEAELAGLPPSSGDPAELLVIEKLLGQIKVQKAAAAERDRRVLNFIETARRKLLAASLVPPPSPPPVP